MEYKDYVVAKLPNKKLLCQAPAWSNLKPGDEIIIDTGHRGKVVSVITLDDEAQIFDIILPIANQDRIPKIKSKIDYKEFTYTHEADSDEQTV